MHLSQDTKLATESNPIVRVAMLYVVTHALHITGIAAPSIVESFFELSAGAELHYRRTTFRPSWQTKRLPCDGDDEGPLLRPESLSLPRRRQTAFRP